MSSISGDQWTVHHGDCRQVMAALPERSVHCVVTSPPYWGGIRDYGIEHYLPLIQERAATPWVPKDQRKPKSAKKRKRDKMQGSLF